MYYARRKNSFTNVKKHDLTARLHIPADICEVVHNKF